MTPDQQHAKHHHCGNDHRSTDRHRLGMVLMLTAAYLVAEIVGGLWTNSLALLADAGHMLADVASLALAYFAAWLVGRPAPPQRTFGYHRAEILAALVNGAALLAASAVIAVEAVQRLLAPPEVFGAAMLAIASGGLAVNLLAMRVLHGAHSTNLNVRAAWLHLMFDTLGSVAAIVSGILVWVFDWYAADPAASIVIAVLVVYSAWRLIVEATGVLMESAPKGIDVDAVRNAIAATPGVVDLHDLHIWSITTDRVCLSVHVVASPELPRGELLNRLNAMLREEFAIGHTTIQVEPDDFANCLNEGCHTAGRLPPSLKPCGDASAGSGGNDFDL